MKNNQEKVATVLANVKVFDYLKEKVGERKTKTEAYCDLLDKSLAGFVSPFLRNQEYGLLPNQCHVTVSDLAAEWHWHRATVRSFLDTLEALGQLRRERLTKSVVITMSVQSGHSAEPGIGQEKPGLAMQLRAVLSDWITGKTDADEAGTACGHLVRQAMNEAGVQDRRPDPKDLIRVNLAPDDDERAVKIRTVALECIALAAMQRALRKSRFDDGSELMDYFRLELYGDWTGFVATSKGLAELILDTDRTDCTDDDDDDMETLKTLLRPFLSLAARAQEATFRAGD